MMNNDELFDIRMKEKFKKEVQKIPENINEEFENVLTLIGVKEDENMKRLNKRKRVGAIAASILCLLCASTFIMQTAFAQEIVNQIIRSLSLKNITIFENKDYKWQDKDIPEAAKGKVFDKNKNVIEKITLANKDEMYNVHGEKVLDVEPDGTLVTEALQQQNMEKNRQEHESETLIIHDSGKLNGYTCFDIKLPAYLPEGFEFYSAEFYKDDKGGVYDKGCSLYFMNNKTEDSIFIAQTYVCEETAGETSFDNIEKVKVNGADAILGDEGIVWEYNGIRYLMYTYNLGRTESIKIAKSIR